MERKNTDIKQFTEEIINKLEESRRTALDAVKIPIIMIVSKRSLQELVDICFGESMDIVRRLVSEYRDKDCSQCSRRKWYQIGYADAEKESAKEDNEDDFCKWRGSYNFDEHYVYHTSCENYIEEEHTSSNFQFCPYCSRRIKVIEEE